MTKSILKICREEGQSEGFLQNNKPIDEIICWAEYENKILPLSVLLFPHWIERDLRSSPHCPIKLACLCLP